MIDPVDFCHLAKKLLQKHPISKSIANESAFRTVIDRAYYAIFLQARQWLEINEKFIPTGTGKDHVLVEKRLKTSRKLGNQRHTLAGKYHDLRSSRKDASYELMYNFSKRDAKDAITKAEIFIKSLP